MIPHRMGSPKVPFHPQTRIGRRKIIHRHGAEPNVTEAFGNFYQVVVGQHPVIVPNEAAMDGWPIDAQREDKNNHRSHEQWNMLWLRDYRLHERSPAGGWVPRYPISLAVV